MVSRFLHALSYAFAVDAPEHLDEESIAARVSTALLRLETAPVTPGRLAGELHAAWVGGAGAAFADAPARARRLRETRSALVGSGTLPAPQLEPAVFVAAAVGEVVAGLRDDPPKRLSQPLAYQEAFEVARGPLAGK